MPEIQERNCFNCSKYMTCQNKWKDDWTTATKELCCWKPAKVDVEV